jgi:hypothetical protein
MTDAHKENTTPPGSEEIPGQRSDGAAVSSCEVTGPDAQASCAVGTGQENMNDETGGKGQKTCRPVHRLVERKTELRGLGIAPPRGKKSMIRKRTEQDLNVSNPEVPCAGFETAARDLVCSLMERQDWMNEQLFVKINDLGYRMDDLEADIGDLKQAKRSG